MSTDPAIHVRNLADIQSLRPDVTALRGSTLRDADVDAIFAFTSLQSLDLCGSDQVTDRAIGSLRNLTSLEEIDLSFCNQITDESVLHISTLPKLRVLVLYACYNITDTSLLALAKCQSLETLSLQSCEGVTDVGVTAIAVLPNLKNLALPEFAAISDETLLALATSTYNLESLRLVQLSGITSRGVTALAQLKKLKSLKISGCAGVERAALDELQLQLPECMIGE